MKTYLFHNYFPRYHELKQEEKINNLICQTYSCNKDGLNLFHFQEYGPLGISIVVPKFTDTIFRKLMSMIARKGRCQEGMTGIARKAIFKYCVKPKQEQQCKDCILDNQLATILLVAFHVKMWAYLSCICEMKK